MNKNVKPNKVTKKKSVWHRELYWCPSQLWKVVTHGSESYKLYARWRHTNPWQGHIVALNKSTDEVSGGTWSTELLRSYNFTEDTKVETIEQTLESLFEDYVVKRTKTIVWNVQE